MHCIINLNYDKISCTVFQDQKEINFHVDNSGVDGYIIDSVLFMNAIEKIILFYKNLNIKINDVYIYLNDKIITSKTYINQFNINGAFEVNHYEIIKQKIKKNCIENDEEYFQHEILEYIVDGSKINEPLKLYIKEIQIIANVVYIKKQYLKNIEKIFQLFNIQIISFVPSILFNYKTYKLHTKKTKILFFELKENCINYLYSVNDKIYQINTIEFGLNIVIKKIIDKFEIDYLSAVELCNNYIALLIEKDDLSRQILINDKNIAYSFFIRNIQNEVQKIVNEIKKNITKFPNIESVVFISEKMQILNLKNIFKNLKYEQVFLEQNKINHLQLIKEIEVKKNENFLIKTWRWFLNKK